MPRSRRLVPLILMVAAVLWTGCGKDSAVEAPRALPTSLSWPRIEGAQRYQVRVWSGLRLVFEASARDTVLTLTPSMRRALGAFDSTTVRVRGLQAGVVQGVHEQSLLPSP